jgi:CelD/BcsL family acetyltransferase involved in cellulose biosynthesis
MSAAGSSTPGGLHSELIRDLAVLEGLETGWRRAAVEAGNVFLSPDWYFEHLKAHPATRPAAIAVRDEVGEITGLIPLVDDGRVVRFAGAAYGDRFGAVAIDPNVLDPLDVWRYASPILGRLAEKRLIMLDRVDTRVRPRIRGVVNFVESSDVLPYISLRSSTWGDWLTQRSGNFRSQIKRKQKRLERRDGARFVEVRREADAEAALQVHFDLHYRRREAVGDQSSLASDAARRFHFGLVRRLAANGWLRLWLLECDGAPIASWYGWRIGFCYAYYQAGFDAAYSDYSPGMLLMIKTVEAAFDEGAAEYDLLLGDERYKQRFTADERHVQTTVIGKATSPPFLHAYGVAGARRVYRLLPGDVRSLARRAVAPLVRSRFVDG